MTIGILLGVDIGTSDTKVLATTLAGSEICRRLPPRRDGLTAPGAWAETDAEALADAVIALLDRAAQQAATELGRRGPAWRDRPHRDGRGRGAAGRPGPAGGTRSSPGSTPAAAPRSPRPPAEFPRRVPRPHRAAGVLRWPPSASCSGCAAGHRSRRRQVAERPRVRRAPARRPRPANGRWPPAPGCSTRAPATCWPETLDAARCRTRPALAARLCRHAARAAAGPDLPATLRGAVLTVAGHDHPVAAVGCGVVGADGGVRLLRHRRGARSRGGRDPAGGAAGRLADRGINTVHHVLAGRRLLLGGTKAGLLLRRTLDLLGAADAGRRAELDAGRPATWTGPSRTDRTGVAVAGAANDDGVLRITRRQRRGRPGRPVAGRAATTRSPRPPDVWPRWTAEVGPSRHCDGGRRLDPDGSVRAVKESRSLPGVRFSDRSQAGAFGAAHVRRARHRHAEMLAATGDHSADRHPRSVRTGHRVRRPIHRRPRRVPIARPSSRAAAQDEGVIA